VHHTPGTGLSCPQREPPAAYPGTPVPELLSDGDSFPDSFPDIERNLYIIFERIASDTCPLQKKRTALR
jgi:hypothetical protein